MAHKNAGHFSVELDDVLSAINNIDTLDYGKTRNYINGAVSKLSPFVTHGVISTYEIVQKLLLRETEEKSADEALRRIEPFLFQLAWRDYFHRLWEFHQDDIFSDLNHRQESRVSSQMPDSVLNAQTGIEVIDQELSKLFEIGYIHNHSRLWIAAYACNILGTDWRTGASWMHYHLLDGDLASNTLSWQWVAGTLNGNKKQYVANQENINRYGLSEQTGTVLDASYDALTNLCNSLKVDDIKRSDWRKIANSKLPKELVPSPLSDIVFSKESPIFLRNVYNLDQNWHTEKGVHLLLIEPNKLEQMPLSAKRWSFIVHWCQSIKNLFIVVSDFSELSDELRKQGLDESIITYQEHPLSEHWQGVKESRQWLFDGLSGDYPSFFKFWNTAKKHVKRVGVDEYFSLNDLASHLLDK